MPVNRRACLVVTAVVEWCPFGNSHANHLRHTHEPVSVLGLHDHQPLVHRRFIHDVMLWHLLDRSADNACDLTGKVTQQLLGIITFLRPQSLRVGWPYLEPIEPIHGFPSAGAAQHGDNTSASFALILERAWDLFLQDKI